MMAAFLYLLPALAVGLVAGVIIGLLVLPKVKGAGR